MPWLNPVLDWIVPKILVCLDTIRDLCSRLILKWNLKLQSPTKWNSRNSQLHSEALISLSQLPGKLVQLLMTIMLDSNRICIVDVFQPRGKWSQLTVWTTCHGRRVANTHARFFRWESPTVLLISIYKDWCIPVVDRRHNQQGFIKLLLNT